MKKVKLTGRLSLNKETIARLTNAQMNAIQGGDLLTVACPSNPPTAATCTCACTTTGTTTGSGCC